MLKEQEGTSRAIMLIGSTGFRTFADSRADLHEVIKNCREAKIMLLNPFSKGARICATSIPDPAVTMDHFQKQIQKSIEFLKDLNQIKIHKNLRLKLYNDVPFLKLTMLGDYIWVQHYHPGMDVKIMPEYVFKHNRKSRGFCAFFHQYFLSRWNDPTITEYDFDDQDFLAELRSQMQTHHWKGCQ
ncbi:MAG: hypothetical protein K9L83_01600 [Deltaproteobacteria bacterium]|nr:hypothetical protein [Deltaproteobacteria bacterium]